MNEGRTPKIVRLPEQEIVDDLLMDLKDRRGLRQTWEGIDQEIQEEIRVHWEYLVQERLRQHGLVVG